MSQHDAILAPQKLKQRLFLLFWLTFLLSLSFELSAIYQRSGALHYAIVLTGRMACIAAVVYAHVYYFIPWLLRRKRYVLFAGSLVFCFVLLYFGTALFHYLIRLFDGKTVVFPTSRTYHLVLIFSTFRIVFLAYLLHLALEWIDQRYSIQQLELQKKEAENRYLRNQLNPHFLFNTMNNLHGLILTDTRLASETVLRLSDFLQYMVYDSSALTIPLEKELQMVGDYLALERLRADEKKIIEFDTDIRDPNYHIAPLVLLPLVENGIKHGLNVVEEGAFLRVRIRQELDLLQVEVVNAKAVTSYGEGGIGLQNLRHRLQLQYPGQYSLVTANEDTFFRTTLTVTLHAA